MWMDHEPPENVRNVGIVGTGIIGSGWTSIFLSRGYTVTAFVRSDASEAKFKGFLKDAWRKVMARGLTSDPEGWRAVQCTQSLADCVRNADYVQESVVEQLSLKQDIIGEIDRLARPGVHIGSSSSFLPISVVRVKATAHPERIATAHPTLPAWDDFVEVLGATPASTAWLAEFFGPTGVGMDVVTMRKEAHGHVHNAVLNSMVTATVLLNSGVCSAADLDKALVHLGRLVVASGGTTGAMVGMVGGGSAQATTELSCDIVIGAPMAVGATAISWGLRGGVARCALRMLQAISGPMSRSAWVKGLVRRFLTWWNAPIYERWEELKPGFEQRAISRLNKLSAMDDV